MPAYARGAACEARMGLIRWRALFPLLLAPGLAGAGDFAPVPEPPPMPQNYQPAPEPEASPRRPETIPEVTLRPDTDGAMLEEYRVRGRIYMIKVTPDQGGSYYLIDQEGTRQFRRSDEPIQPPVWILRRFQN